MRGRITSGIGGLGLLVAACGGGGGGSSAPTSPPVTPPVTPTALLPVPAQEALTTIEVGRIVAQAVAEAQARGRPATIAVVDRVGNVLAVFAMTGSNPSATLRPGPGGNTDLQGVTVPATLAAIAKAITAAYLSSGGNAFSTRTASQIVQERFPPSAAAAGLESGPLFGVQFSSLPCSDLTTRAAQGTIGPKRSPLGLAADPGGLPLYKNGVLVGGVGVMADGDYGFDPEVQDVDTDDEELIAVGASQGFAAPAAIRAERIAVDGTTLRFTDRDAESLKAPAGAAPDFATVDGTRGVLVAVPGYYPAAALVAGVPVGAEASGIRKAAASDFADPDAYVLTDGGGGNRFPPRAGTDAGDVAQPLTADEVRALLEEAFKVMVRARAQIRQPSGSRAEVTIAVTDTRGAVLGIIRAVDAPVFGADVALQKARTASFFSSPYAAADLGAATTAGGGADANVRDFVARTNAFVGDAGFLNGRYAVSVRAVGNLARPYFPDGQLGTPNGPLSRPIAQFSPFSTGLQSALIVQNLTTAPDAPKCTFLPSNRLANGLQIFAGGEPVYRGGVLVGGIGVSGDGIDQDDMIGFLGISNAAARAAVNQPAAAIRSDQIVIGGIRLRYVNCPVAPFVDAADQNVCQGK